MATDTTKEKENTFRLFALFPISPKPPFALKLLLTYIITLLLLLHISHLLLFWGNNQAQFGVTFYSHRVYTEKIEWMHGDPEIRTHTQDCIPRNLTGHTGYNTQKVELTHRVSDLEGRPDTQGIRPRN